MSALLFVLGWLGVGILVCVVNYLIRPPRQEGE